MSADNWTVCPKCAQQPNPYHEPLDWTLREDYEIGIRKGEFMVGYRAFCGECGFTKTFEHTERIQ